VLHRPVEPALFFGKFDAGRRSKIKTTPNG
jgi:hypothetical protein